MTATPTDRILDVASRMSGRTANLESRLRKDLALDSLDCIELAMQLEEEFGIDIPDADVDRPELGTIGGLVTYIEGRIG